ncbi:MAG: DUF1761 domain-containing protein [Alphaproteobacteria bacterium]|nr:DUF1761 domain-containing protein [Alphaproteobacteria bacterium]
MEYLGVFVAAIASYAFGAAWYMVLAKRWMAAAGVSQEDASRKNPVPLIISFVMAVLVAGMMRHIFAMAGIDTPNNGLWAGFGLGAFIAVPWIITNYAFAGRSMRLMFIDGLYAVVGCTIMGLVLTLF